MNKKRKKGKKHGPEPHPTIFVIDGSVRLYEDGSMLELHTQITEKEWELIASDTLKYLIFIKCLKTVAFPILKEEWTKIDDWWRLQLEIAVSRIKNITPTIYLGFDEDKLKAMYTAQMTTNANSVVNDIRSLRDLNNTVCDKSITTVSDL